MVLGDKLGKPKTFRPWNPEQTLLLPPSPVDWLPANHLVFFLLDLAAELDMGVIYAIYQQRDPRGVKAYEPRMMGASATWLVWRWFIGWWPGGSKQESEAEKER